MRLQKVLAQAGIASRRHSEILIAQGLVKVNGQTVTQLGLTVDPEKDRIEVRGQRLSSAEPKIYLALNKPRGYLSSVYDPHGRKTVIDLLPEFRKRIYPVGRLDYDSQGLLILTNDGELTYALTHPSRHIPKVYRVLVKGIPPPAQLKLLSEGIPLEEGLTAKAGVCMIKSGERSSLLEIVLFEGKKRQIKRMCAYIGHPVLGLTRVKIGPVGLNGLKPGKFRHLSAREVKELKQLTGQMRRVEKENKRMPGGGGN